MKSIWMAVLLLLGACGSLVSGADTINGKVVRVSDGDTVTVLDATKTQHRIRLLDIDAPESSQAFGQKSKALLASLIAGRDVRVEFKEKDKYGRVLGTIFLDELNVNLKMVQEGMAWRYHYSKSPVYGSAEQAARAARKGLWADKSPLDPWAFRKLKKGGAPPAAAPRVQSGN